MKPKVCFLDVDGVLSDFYGASLKAAGLDPKAVEAATGAGPGYWNYFKPFLTEGDFWGRIDSVTDFWETLPKTSEADAIVDICEQYFGNRVYLLTAPPLNPLSVAGKAAWVRDHFPKLYRRLLVGSAKESLAHAGAVLVDDSESNIRKFTEAGGHTVLVPRRWNALHEHEHRLLEIVDEALKEVCNAA